MNNFLKLTFDPLCSSSIRGVFRVHLYSIYLVFFSVVFQTVRWRRRLEVKFRELLQQHTSMAFSWERGASTGAIGAVIIRRREIGVRRGGDTIILFSCFHVLIYEILLIIPDKTN